MGQTTGLHQHITTLLSNRALNWIEFPCTDSATRTALLASGHRRPARWLHPASEHGGLYSADIPAALVALSPEPPQKWTHSRARPPASSGTAGTSAHIHTSSISHYPAGWQ